MKKRTVILIFIIMSLSITIYYYFALFGHKRVHKFEVVDFSVSKKDSLIPYISKGYSTQIIKINGNVDDTIRIKGFYGNSIYLTGNIDKEYYIEYYGGTPAFMSFEPYKAKKGKLKIKHIIK